MKKVNLSYLISMKVGEYNEEYTLEEIIKLAERKLKRVLKKRTLQECEKAWELNEEGNGASTIAWEMGLKFNTVCLMIDTYQIDRILNK